MRIKVKQDHIKRGCKGVATACPIAIALAEQAGGRWTVNGQYAQRWEEYDSNGCYSTRAIDQPAPLPPEAIAFVKAFDHTNEAYPFDFELEIPQ